MAIKYFVGLVMVIKNFEKELKKPLNQIRINTKASPGVDRIDARAYEENRAGNIQRLAQQVKEQTYQAKLVPRKWIPKAGGKLRRLGLPSIADKLLQRAVRSY